MTIFHFDINGTIIGVDATDNHSIEEAVLESVCRSIPYNGDTYYNHLKKSFTDYKKHVKNVLSVYPEHFETCKKLCIVYHKYFFPSFLKVIENLKEHDKIFLRTFGQDGQDVIDKLRKLYNLEFCVYHCKYNYGEAKFYYESNGISTDPRIIYSVSNTCNKHVLIIDDYQYWNNNNREAKYGKFIPYITDMPHTKTADTDLNVSIQKQIAFDDNDCMWTDNSDKVKIHKIVTIDAALDEYYYLNFINKSNTVTNTNDGQVIVDDIINTMNEFEKQNQQIKNNLEIVGKQMQNSVANLLLRKM
jgi:predicted transcriptional regulator